ncbi:magnesium transporter CorA family protein [Neobacillus sp. D3-1R]|uniref:magnesium transporter CorA family protein n=1 Tax=Neobacillus sp. D3-1R TaxID=3445778 RepID=UPI003FA12724
MLKYNREKKTVTKIEHFQIPEPGEIVWFHMDSTEQLPNMIADLGLHPLAKKLFTEYSDYPKVNIFKNEAIVSLYIINNDFKAIKMTILISEHFILSHIENDEKKYLQDLENFFLENHEFMEATGLILYHLINRASEYFLSAIDRIANEIQHIERLVFKNPFENEIGKKVYRWKLKLHELRQIVEPQENVIKTITHSDFPFLNENSGFYFQDLKENFARVTSAFDTFKENLNGIFNLQISLKSDHTNAIMKTLTLVSVIFIPMTFIAGLYGMNFENMPELKMKNGYFYALTLMLVLGLSIMFFFRFKGWWGKKRN